MLDYQRLSEYCKKSAEDRKASPQNKFQIIKKSRRSIQYHGLYGLYEL